MLSKLIFFVGPESPIVQNICFRPVCCVWRPLAYRTTIQLWKCRVDVHFSPVCHRLNVGRSHEVQVRHLAEDGRTNSMLLGRWSVVNMNACDLDVALTVHSPQVAGPLPCNHPRHVVQKSGELYLGQGTWPNKNGLVATVHLHVKIRISQYTTGPLHGSSSPLMRFEHTVQWRHHTDLIRDVLRGHRGPVRW